MLKVGSFIRSSGVIVAPMAGITDQPFRNCCRQFGADWVVSEMVTSNSKLWKTAKSIQRLRFHDEAEPRWIQIAGAEPAEMASAARMNVDQGAQIIDINMGCPAKKVCRKAAGSALLRDEALVGSILEAVVEAVDVPVTLKIRLGWSREELNALRIARIAEESGIQLLTVHGRTRQCRFAGQVDYEAIARVKESVAIPVIANGDITGPLQARHVLDITGADGVMIGRAVQGRPWLPGMIAHYLQSGELASEPSKEIIWSTIRGHLKALSDFYGEPRGVRVARKHLGSYLDALLGSRAKVYKRQFNRLETSRAQAALIDRLFSQTSIAA
ncbi:MAG: tRNA dihydrouridine synthase DusB [Gammaproteobacteria bacterium]|jgi:tRNA-dihydrouridine synthase B|nr:tRNA dihydrouridine synthase DusB [Gammaproteobacteria bacterium]|tara:strand:- start:185 stop:1168 length:984 start_codon:yes stop_codon:yes gene_type:complete